MNCDRLDMLAAGDLARLLPLMVILAILGIAKVISVLKDKYEQERAERDYQQKREERERGGGAPAPGRSAPPQVRQRTPAQQAMRTLREVLTGVEEAAAPPPPPEQPPQVQQRQRVAARPRLGEGVQAEMQRSEAHLTAEEEGRRRRLGKVGRLRPRILAGPGAEAGEGDRGSELLVDLSNRDEAMLGIVYSEILGPPKALRTGPDPWDL